MADIETALNKLRPSLVADAINAMRHTGISLYVHGATGIAKSAVARQVADSQGMAFIDIRLSQMAPEDVRGVPMLGEIDGMKGVVWNPPLFFPRDLDYQNTEVISGSKTIRFFNPLGNNGIHYCTKPDISAMSINLDKIVEIVDRQLDRFTVHVKDNNGEPATATIAWSVTGAVHAILALEEFNSAPLAVMAASYQLILDRRLGDYLVPDGVMLLAMGNRDSDRGVTYKLPKPVANRFVHIEMIVDIDDWMTWGVSNHLHSTVLGYISRWPSKLLDFDPNSPVHSFATPRSWEFVSKVLTQEGMTREIVGPLVCGAIGTAIGTEFLLHREFMEDMPDPQQILDGKVTTFRPKNPHYATQIAYSTTIQILYLLKEHRDEVKRQYPQRLAEERSPENKQWWKFADHALGYMIDHFPPEVTAVGLRIGMQTYGLRFGESPRYQQFTKLNQDLFF